MDLIKIVWHDGIGMSPVLWPSPADGIVAISASRLAYMLDGIDLSRVDLDEKAYCVTEGCSRATVVYPDGLLRTCHRCLKEWRREAALKLVFGTAPAGIISLDSEKERPVTAQVNGNYPVDLPLRLDDAGAPHQPKLLIAGGGRRDGFDIHAAIVAQYLSI